MLKKGKGERERGRVCVVVVLGGVGRMEGREMEETE